MCSLPLHLLQALACWETSMGQQVQAAAWDAQGSPDHSQADHGVPEGLMFWLIPAGLWLDPTCKASAWISMSGIQLQERVRRVAAY